MLVLRRPACHPACTRLAGPVRPRQLRPRLLPPVLAAALLAPARCAQELRRQQPSRRWRRIRSRSGCWPPRPCTTSLPTRPRRPRRLLLLHAQAHQGAGAQQAQGRQGAGGCHQYEIGLDTMLGGMEVEGAANGLLLLLANQGFSLPSSRPRPRSAALPSPRSGASIRQVCVHCSLFMLIIFLFFYLSKHHYKLILPPY